MLGLLRQYILISRRELGILFGFRYDYAFTSVCTQVYEFFASRVRKTLAVLYIDIRLKSAQTYIHIQYGRNSLSALISATEQLVRPLSNIRSLDSL